MLLCTTLIFSCFTSIIASAKVGDVIGTALHTDIVAYINHYAIPSYAVNGQSVIVAEDLRNFGFDVAWNGYDRILTIARNGSPWVTPMDFKKDSAFGKKFTNILQTDIKVYAGGRQITSYAMNGYTMIPIEELNMFGEVYWVAGERAIKLWVDGLTIRPTMQKIEIEYPITSKTYSFLMPVSNGYDYTWKDINLLTIKSPYSYKVESDFIWVKAPASFTVTNSSSVSAYKFSNNYTTSDYINTYWTAHSLSSPRTAIVSFSYYMQPPYHFTLPPGNYIFELNSSGEVAAIRVLIEE